MFKKNGIFVFFCTILLSLILCFFLKNKTNRLLVAKVFFLYYNVLMVNSVMKETIACFKRGLEVEQMQGNKRYTALIVDDSEMNREILKEILMPELDVVEKDNGEEACEYMINHSNEINIVILDLVMPGMDGFGVLKFMKYKHLIDILPVMMISADSDGSNIEKAFDLGVIDFLSRPFSERIVLRRVMTTIRLFKKQKELVDELDRQYRADDMRIDDLTGLDYKQTFFNKVYTHLRSHPNDKLLMIAIDIDHFKLFNNYYGWETGDQYLKLIAKYMKEYTQRYGGFAGYLGGDDFALLSPVKRAELMRFARKVWEHPMLKDFEVGFGPKVGVYEIQDTAESVASIYDHAKIALENIKDDYSQRISRYEHSMEEKVRDEFELLVDIKRGIKEEEFIFYVQPKVDMKSGKIVGGEALVRWKHKDKGLVSPGVFIPVLEKNGFISQVDKVVWQNVAKWQKEWIAEGHRPVPLSINVSRADIFTMDVTGFLTDLMDQYDLPRNLLEVEITESAYVEDLAVIREELDRLHKAGFTVLMDDFGSGYSSLNTLKDLAIDILKIDMKFLHMDVNNINKGVSILESVVNMSRSLQLPTIVEGVETKEQVDILTKMGCVYAQGFHFYMPMPTEEFERLLLEEEIVDYDGIFISEIEPIHVHEFLDENLFSDVVINNILGPVAFYEVESDGTIRLIRMNDQYSKLAGREFASAEEWAQRDLLDRVKPKHYDNFPALFEAAYNTQLKGIEDDLVFTRLDGKKVEAMMRLFFLRERPNVRVFYASMVEKDEK